jgi:predicted negative regulator of RcsB-dependent stress response
MIRRVLFLGGLGVLIWRVWQQRQAGGERASVGFADGTSVVLEPGAPELDRLLEIARGTLR